MSFRRLTPRSRARTRVLAAAAIWTAVGAALVLLGSRRIAAGGAGWAALQALAVIAGWLKGSYVLAPLAAANARRIVDAGDGRCLGGVFAWGSWALVVAMMACGAGLRRSPIPPPWTGWIYLAVGTGLLRGSVPAWRAGRRAFVGAAATPARRT